ncbi:MAG: PAS domain S-box protein, partial [Myxococcota bacterium]
MRDTATKWALSWPPPFEAGLGVAVGLALWLAAAAVHVGAATGRPLGREPVLWVLVAAPVVVGLAGWVAGWRRLDRERLDTQLRKGAEQKLRELASREWVTRSMLQNAFDAVLIVSGDGVVLDANVAAGRMFGNSGEGMVGFAIATLLPDHDRLGIPTDRWTDPHGVELRTRAQHADGSVFPVDVHASPVDDRRIRLYTVREASTRMKQEERLVREAVATQRDKWVLEQRKRGLVLQMLGNGLRDSVDRMLAEVDAAHPGMDDLLYGMLEQLDQLWTLAMWERSGASPTVGPVELAAVLREVVADVRVVADRQRNRLVTDVMDGVDEIVTDANLLACALRTIVLLALRRIQDATVRVEVVREPGRGTDWVTVFVEDDGAALTTDQLDAIQAAFEVSEEASPPPDARAGVALARRLARALGGHVAVDSRSGVGTAI